MTRDEEIEAVANLTDAELEQMLKLRKQLAALEEEERKSHVEWTARLRLRYEAKRAKLIEAAPDEVRRIMGVES